MSVTRTGLELGLRESNFLMPAIILMGVAAATVVGAVFLQIDVSGSYPYLFLLPWIIALVVIFALPSAILVYLGKFKLHDPLVFATWTYFLPAFGLGGIILAFGWSQPYFLEFIQDPTYELPLTVSLIALGFLSLSAGYFLPVGYKLGSLLGRLIPDRDYVPSSSVGPSLLLLFSGILISLAAFFLGIIGFQKVVEAGSFDGLIYLTTMYWMEATFILWCFVFSQRGFDLRTGAIAVLLLLTSFGKTMLLGNRGSLLQLFLIVVVAYSLSGRKLDVKRSIWAAAMLFVCLLVGVIYGTTFRSVKGSEEQVSADEYAESIFDTMDRVSEADNLSTLQFGMATLAERLEALSSVGVVVSRHEQLQPYEESYGLDGNIWKDLATSFIPRMIWKDKPVASDARKFSDLYFDYGESSFTITPIGDLLRNFGVIGIGIGMFLLGIILRVIYRVLIEDRPFVIWRGAV